jgi:hypothetical protein
MRGNLLFTALALVGAWGAWPAPALAGRCAFDSEIKDITSGELRRTVQARLAQGWDLGFQQVGERRAIFVTVGTFGGNGAFVPAGQRFTARFDDGTVMYLVSTRPSEPRVVGSYAEYTFWFGTTAEALLVFSNLGIERFQMDLFGNLVEGIPGNAEKKAAIRNASCIQEPSFRG